jgi:ubiquinone/menaquinone biosynthesis C-methylase UbiE
MSHNIELKLARSLTASTTESIPFLPYLLQDLWELGASPADIIHLMKTYGIAAKNLKILDLGCGKGAVGIKLAKAFGCEVKGIDLMPGFVEYAKQKAEDWDVSPLCEFAVGDINHALKQEREYDVVILGAIGDVLGRPRETLLKLKNVLKPNGYIIIDDAYLRDDKDRPPRWSGEYLCYKEWLDVFRKTGVRLIGEKPADARALSQRDEQNHAAIIARAGELKARHPQLSRLFDDYIQNQRDECDDLSDAIIGVTWLLQRENG